MTQWAWMWYGVGDVMGGFGDGVWSLDLPYPCRAQAVLLDYYTFRISCVCCGVGLSVGLAVPGAVLGSA